MLTRLLLALAVPLALAGCTAVAPSPAATDATLAGAAAANDPRAGAIGEEILRRGGIGRIAAVAMLMALSVVEPVSTGLGGGGFYMRGAADGTVESIDGREMAPAAATGTWFLDDEGTPRTRDAAVMSGLSIGVPGNVALAAEAHRRHGSLPWAELLAPAIALAREGFPLTVRLSDFAGRFADRGARDPAGRAVFYDDDGSARLAGEMVYQPELADTLEMIARDGPQAFYSGDFASGMAARIAADTPGVRGMSAADIAGYAAEKRDPACIFYRLYRVCAMGPPSSGGYAVLATLKQLERFDLAALGLQSPVTWHLFLEAQRLAYADRAFYIADPAFADVPLDGLLDAGYLARRSALIDPDATIPHAVPGKPDGAPLVLAEGERWPEHGTTHFVAVDAHGDMVSLTSTVEGAFGSGLVYRGFYLNNELTDFSFIPEEEGKPAINRVEGGKRPASSMSPTLVYDPQGQPFLSIGAAGGGLIPVQTARSIVGIIDFGLPLREALGLPFVMAIDDNRVLAEKDTWMEALGPQLEALGHEQVIPFDQLLRTTGALHTADGWIAAFDPRLDPLVRIPDRPGEVAAPDTGYSEGM